MPQAFLKGCFRVSGLSQAEGESIGVTPVSFRFTYSTGTTPLNAIYIGDISTVAGLAERIAAVINSNDVPGTASFDDSSVTFTPYSGHEDEVAVSSQASNISVEGVGTDGVIVIRS